MITPTTLSASRPTIKVEPLYGPQWSAFCTSMKEARDVAINKTFIWGVPTAVKVNDRTVFVTEA